MTLSSKHHQDTRRKSTKTSGQISAVMALVVVQHQILAFFVVTVLLTVIVKDVGSFHAPTTTTMVPVPANALVPSQVVSSSNFLFKTTTNRKTHSNSRSAAANTRVHLINPNRASVAASTPTHAHLIPSQVKRVATKRRNQQSKLKKEKDNDQQPGLSALASQDAQQVEERTSSSTKAIANDTSSSNHLKKNPRRRRQQRPKTAVKQSEIGSLNTAHNVTKGTFVKDGVGQKNLRPTRTSRRQTQFGSLPDTQW